MWRRALKVMAVSYAIKTLVFLGVWLAAPDLVRQGRDKVRDAWASVTGAAPVSAAVPAQATGATLQPVGMEAGASTTAR